MTKQIYIWQYVEQVSTSWHSGGGLVIVTDRDPQVAWEEFNDAIAEEDASNADYRKIGLVPLPKPDRVIPVGSGEVDGVFVFEDAGCC